MSMNNEAVMRFKAKLAARETTVLFHPKYAVGSLVQFCGSLGFDAVMLDCEQGTASFDAVEDCSRAARLAGVASIVRVPSADPSVIERHLYRGVDGIVVPRLDTAEQVHRALSDIRYCFNREFSQRAVIIQVESASAVNEIDGFLDVPDIDCFFIGGIDLAKSMGFMGDYHHPEVVSAIEKTFDRIRSVGKSVGMMVRPDDIDFWTSRGANMLFVLSHDLLSLGAKQIHTTLGGARKLK